MISFEPLTGHLGAEVQGADPEQLLSDDDRARPAAGRAGRERRARVPGPAARRRDPGAVLRTPRPGHVTGDPGHQPRPGQGAERRVPQGRLRLALRRRPGRVPTPGRGEHGRGDHPRRRRHRVREHLRRLRPAVRRRAGAVRVGAGRPRPRRASASSVHRPHARAARALGREPEVRAPARVDPPLRSPLAGDRRDRRPRGRHELLGEPGVARRPPRTCDPSRGRVHLRLRARRHDHVGQPRRAPPRRRPTTSTHRGRCTAPSSRATSPSSSDRTSRARSG